MKDVEIPAGMQRAMARQAEAERERRAKIIAAEGEFQASERLTDAADVMAKSPMALQLRYLQTLLEIGATNATTIVFPAPIDLIRPLFMRARPHPATGGASDERARRRDPARGRPGRRSRPGPRAGGRGARVERVEPSIRASSESAPSAPGREDRTPPETLRLGPADTRRPTRRDGSVRVVPNLYPGASSAQEVVVQASHRASRSALDDPARASPWHGSRVASSRSRPSRRSRIAGGHGDARTKAIVAPSGDHDGASSELAGAQPAETAAVDVQRPDAELIWQSRHISCPRASVHLETQTGSW